MSRKHQCLTTSRGALSSISNTISNVIHSTVVDGELVVNSWWCNRDSVGQCMWHLPNPAIAPSPFLPPLHDRLDRMAKPKALVQCGLCWRAMPFTNANHSCDANDCGADSCRKGTVSSSTSEAQALLQCCSRLVNFPGSRAMRNERNKHCHSSRMNEINRPSHHLGRG